MKYCIIWQFYVLLIVCKCSYARKSQGSQWTSKIVNGIPVPISMFPYVALITTKRADSVHCGGSIISDRVILTAAHCIQDSFGVGFSADFFTVYLGSSKPMKGEKYDVCEILPHPMYRRDKRYHISYDIGLMLLKNRIKFSDNVQKATLPTSRSWKVSGKLLTVIGFGITQTTGGPSDKLLMTRMSYVDNNTCSRSQYQFKEPVRMAPHMFCLLSKYWSSDCYGDSGSPVISGRYVVGLVSAGKSAFCGSDMMPSMYTEVLHFRKWINTSMNKLKKVKCIRKIRKMRKESPTIQLGRSIKIKS